MYLFDTNIKETKSIVHGIKKIYGLGKYKSKNICKKIGFSNNLLIKRLNSEQQLKITKHIEQYENIISAELKKQLKLNNKKLLSIGLYRGQRKNRGLPVRGQRTHTNAKTAKKYIYK